MTETQAGYVKKYNQNEGYGFCIVHDLNGERDYTDVFFHISDVCGYKGVSEKQHVLWGKVSKTSKGWKMTDIKATYDPDAWNRRPKRVQKQQTDVPFESKQSKRLPPSLRNKDRGRDDSKSRPYRKPNKKKDKEGGYWKGDKYIPE